MTTYSKCFTTFYSYAYLRGFIINLIDMKRPKTENLTAWVTGRNLNVFQKSDAVIEYNKLLDYVKVIEEQLRIGGVSQRSELFCKCTTDTDIYQSEGFIKCQTCYKPIKMQNCG